MNFKLGYLYQQLSLFCGKINLGQLIFFFVTAQNQAMLNGVDNFANGIQECVTTMQIFRPKVSGRIKLGLPITRLSKRAKTYTDHQDTNIDLD